MNESRSCRLSSHGNLKDQMNHKSVAIYQILLKHQYGIWTIDLWKPNPGHPLAQRPHVLGGTHPRAPCVGPHLGACHNRRYVTGHGVA